MPEHEFRGWLKYFAERPPDVQEIQMAMLMSTVAGFAGSKKVKMQDFILSGIKEKKPPVPIGMSSDAVRSVFSGIAKKL